MELVRSLPVLAAKLGIYDFLTDIGIEAFAFRIVRRKILRKTQEFYKQNRSRVRKVISMMCDEVSRDTIKRAVLFRMYYIPKVRPRVCGEKEYFNSLTIPYLRKNEVFIDCGAYTGDTMDEFAGITKNQFERIVAFEPDQGNFNQMKAAWGGDDRVVMQQAGVWDSNTVLQFNATGDICAKVSEVSNFVSDKGYSQSGRETSIQAVAIDKIDECKDATFIKMDIEGAETFALRGARDTIIKNRPILTICLYHTDNDMLCIPEWINENLSDYSIYCRHHSKYVPDTILYAIPSERMKSSQRRNNGKI